MLLLVTPLGYECLQALELLLWELDRHPDSVELYAKEDEHRCRAFDLVCGNGDHTL